MFHSLLYLIVLYGACIAGLIQIGTRSGLATHATNRTHFIRRVPWATLLLSTAISIPTTLQFFFPSILVVLRRDAAAFSAGDWWRIVTPLFVQDEGVSGSIFNLSSLLLVGSVAESLWGWARWLIIFFVGGILGEIISFAWQPVGAGNSLANFSLAGSVAVMCLTLQPLRMQRIASELSLGAGLLLLLLHDHHGAATAFGCCIAIALIWFDHYRPGKLARDSDPEGNNSP